MDSHCISLDDLVYSIYIESVLTHSGLKKFHYLTVHATLSKIFCNENHHIVIPISPKCAHLTLMTQVMSCAKIQATTWSNIDLMQWRIYTSPCLNDQLFQIFVHNVPLHTCSWYTSVTLTSCDMIILCKILKKNRCCYYREDSVTKPFPEQEEALFNPQCQSVALLANIRGWCLVSRDGEYNFNAFRPSHEMNEYIVLYQTPFVCFNTRYRYLKVRSRQISNAPD